MSHGGDIKLVVGQHEQLLHSCQSGRFTKANRENSGKFGSQLLWQIISHDLNTVNLYLAGGSEKGFFGLHSDWWRKSRTISHRPIIVVGCSSNTRPVKRTMNESKNAETAGTYDKRMLCAMQVKNLHNLQTNNRSINTEDGFVYFTNAK